MKEAMLSEKHPDGRVRCGLCDHDCAVADGKRGLCQVRENRGGRLYTLVCGPTITQHADPIEKKPLFHFYPGSTAYSVATPGCNFRCRWPQNWDLSQVVSKPTPAATLMKARETGLRAGLRYVHVGNVPGEEDTFCRQCGRLLIRRDGLRVIEKHIRKHSRNTQTVAGTRCVRFAEEVTKSADGTRRVPATLQAMNGYIYSAQWSVP